ncbi:ABC transporter permease [Cellulomonas bogoriensis]|uniref:ABC transporter permease n=1 Tax=Cellulomonas bogoriensis TaxID=301388 RepID=UPI0018DD217B|nr:ABC transporter permease [Cellulomonas bogoriensis]
MLRPSALRLLRPWVSTLVVVAGWEAVARLGLVRPEVLPPPSALLTTATAMTVDGTLPGALVVSLGRVAAGAGIGITVGVALGLVAAFWRTGADVVDKPVQMLRTIPFTALTPLLILWFGLGESPKILLVVVATLVPMYLNTLGGVRAVDPALVEVATAYRLSAWQTATQVLLPGALAPILVGLRHALGIAWVAVIVAETVNASSGIGYLLTTARTYVRTDQVMVCIAVYACLGLATDSLVRALERRLLRWDRPAPAGTAPGATTRRTP